MKKRLYFDMDGVLVDFESGLAQQDEQTLKEYEGCYDEIPGLFGQMLPMEGAIDAEKTGQVSLKANGYSLVRDSFPTGQQ